MGWLQPPHQPPHSNTKQRPKSRAACLIAPSSRPLSTPTPRGPLPGPDLVEVGRVFQQPLIRPISAEALGCLSLATLSQTALTCSRWPQEAGTSLLPQLPPACPLREMAMDTARSGGAQLTLVRATRRPEAWDGKGNSEASTLRLGRGIDGPLEGQMQSCKSPGCGPSSSLTPLLSISRGVRRGWLLGQLVPRLGFFPVLLISQGYLMAVLGRLWGSVPLEYVDD